MGESGNALQWFHFHMHTCVRTYTHTHAYTLTQGFPCSLHKDTLINVNSNLWVGFWQRCRARYPQRVQGWWLLSGEVISCLWFLFESLSHSSSPFCSDYFGDRDLMNYLPSWSQILPISASQVARIIGMNHQHLVINNFFIQIHYYHLWTY
jgi:hypothetical protein